MAKLIDVWRTDNPADLTRRQLPLIVDENLTMIMDITGLDAVCDHPVAKGKQLEEFTKKYNMLSKEEIKNSFEASCKDLLSILGQAVPCIGCRRSVERLFYDLMKSGHPSLDPLIITAEGSLTIRDDVLESPQLLCTMLQGHSTRLNNIVDKQPRNKKSRRCALHSLEMQRMRPPANAWREAWDCMKAPCRQEITLIETEILDTTLDTYLKKHRFCGECRTKVLLASNLLTKEREPAKEKGYVASLYAGIKRCLTESHVHLPINTEYIATIIGKAQPELMGRERHAKTLEIAQEEVLTCLGICVAERLHRVHRRLKEEETVCKVLGAVAVEALARNFQTAVEVKQGISQLELLYEELTREEIAKQQRREKLRLKRKKKKERRETEEKENACQCSINKDDQIEMCDHYIEAKPTTEDVDRHKLQILDRKNKGPPTCTCADCSKKVKNQSHLLLSDKKQPERPLQRTSVDPNKCNTNSYVLSKNYTSKTNSDNTCVGCSNVNRTTDRKRRCVKCECDACKNCKNPSSQDLMDAWIHNPTKEYIWLEVEKHYKDKLHEQQHQCRCSSEQLSQDCGYSSEHNISSSSIPSTPDGSEVACSDGCCNHDGDCPELRQPDKFSRSTSSISLLRQHGGGITLTQMLEDSYSSEDEGKESYIPDEEVLRFKSQMCQIVQKREKLRQTLKERFDKLCNYHRPFMTLH